MLTEALVVGKKANWGEFVTMVGDLTAPVSSWLNRGDKAVAVTKSYQADKYTAATPVAWPDGKDWDAFESAGKNRKELSTRIQWFVKTAAVSKLAEDVTDVAGIADELAREGVKKTKEMSNLVECTICSDQEEHVDDGVVGHQTRGIGCWVQSGAQSVNPVDSSFRPAAAQIYSGTKANLNEDAIKAVARAMYTAALGKRTVRAFCGVDLKGRFADFSRYIPSDLSTQSSSRVTNRDMTSRELMNIVDIWESDGARLELTLADYLSANGFGGVSTATVGGWRGYFLHKEMWEMAQKQGLQVYKPEFKGGSYKMAMDMILMLICRNPIAEGEVKPSDA